MTLMVDVVLAFVVVEAIILAALGRTAVLPNLAAGFLLLIAMRLAVGDAGWQWVGVALLAAGIAHALDLRRAL